MKRRFEFISFMGKETAIPVIVFIVVSAIWSFFDLKKYWEMAEPLISFATLIVAVSFFVIEKRENWQGSLPKFMNVRFLNAENPQEVWLREDNVYLTGEADIRAWGQSIGQLLNNNERLHFKRKIAISSVVEKDDKGKSHKMYSVDFFLSKKPEVLG